MSDEWEELRAAVAEMTGREVGRANIPLAISATVALLMADAASIQRERVKAEARIAALEARTVVLESALRSARHFAQGWAGDGDISATFLVKKIDKLLAPEAREEP